jgi:hypothetical protein
MKRRTRLVLQPGVPDPGRRRHLVAAVRFRIDRERFDAIQVGMSRLEVERLLGGAAE